MTTEEIEKLAEGVKKNLRNTQAGRLLVRYGYEPWGMEGPACQIAERAAADIQLLVDVIEVLAPDRQSAKDFIAQYSLKPERQISLAETPRRRCLEDNPKLSDR